MSSHAPKKLTEEERLRIENYHLKVENLRLQQERLQSDLRKSITMLQDLQVEIGKYQEALNEKYGVDLLKCHIAADGTISSASVMGGVSP